MSWKYNLSVILNNDSIGKFYTGHIVTGLVTLELKKDLQIKCVNLEVIGISKASWTRASPTVPYIRIYSEKKKIFYVKLNDLFADAFKQDTLIHAGVYYQPFHFALPHDLPSTFKSSIASVNYYIKINSDPAYKLTKSVPFEVLSNVNLNSMDDMLTPCAYEFQRYLRNIAANIKVHLKTYKAFAPGQVIPIEITLHNEKKVKIKKIRIFLVQKIHYSISSVYADAENIICQVDYDKIENNFLEILKINMEIPQIIPSSINVSEPMTDISYDLRMEALISCHHNLVESIPVTVAAVPVIHNNFES